eukprot:3975718-Pyramimonas_sp.AAC.1
MNPSQVGKFVPSYDSDDSSSDDNSLDPDQEYDSEDMVLGNEFTHLTGDIDGAPRISLALDIFPFSDFAMLLDGLNRLPSWTVYPIQLANCLKATTRILASEQGSTRCEPEEPRV